MWDPSAFAALLTLLILLQVLPVSRSEHHKRTLSMQSIDFELQRLRARWQQLVSMQQGSQIQAGVSHGNSPQLYSASCTASMNRMAVNTSNSNSLRAVQLNNVVLDTDWSPLCSSESLRKRTRATGPGGSEASGIRARFCTTDASHLPCMVRHALHEKLVARPGTPSTSSAKPSGAPHGADDEDRGSGSACRQSTSLFTDPEDSAAASSSSCAAVPPPDHAVFSVQLLQIKKSAATASQGSTDAEAAAYLKAHPSLTAESGCKRATTVYIEARFSVFAS
jgi:hypothetical protein